MAINIKNYVDISTTFPSADGAARSFGGLVFTASDMLPQTASDMVDAKDSYDSGSVVYLTLTETGTLFGVESDEYKFATGYYSFISPSGRTPSRISFAKIGATETPKEAFVRVNGITNLFGSFTFLSTVGSGMSSPAIDTELALLKDVASYNQSLDSRYLFVINRVRGSLSASAVANECAEFSSYKGVCYVSGKTDYSGYMPMAILASTDYSNGQVVNFMFKQFGTEEATVVTDSEYTTMNQKYVNFYGLAQTNGQNFGFYQRGYNTDGTETSVYCNEMWLKSQCETEIMNMLVSNERLPASTAGVSKVKLVVMDCCADAQSNGMFMARDPDASDMSSVRELISNIGGESGDVDTIESGISSKGYSVYAYLTSKTDTEKLGPKSEKVIVYYIFYGTADSVRYVKGNDVLMK